MDNPFLRDFLKRREEASKSAPIPKLTHVGGTSKTPSLRGPGEGAKTAKGLAASKPTGKQVEEWFKNRISQLNAEAEAREEEKKVR
jgi:hypothetical protein